MTRLSKLLAFLASAILIGIVVWSYARTKLVNPPYEPLGVPASEGFEPLDEPPQIVFSEPNMSTAERTDFLAGDYKILRSVGEFPESLAKDYTAKGGSRIAMADPGQKFQETDVVVDTTLPWRRLIFAGINGDKAFVHYEEGGIGKSIAVDFFRIQSPEAAAGAWHGFCDKGASNLDDLRRNFSNEMCHR